MDKIMLRVAEVMQARESKYIMLHAPKEKLDKIQALLPGVERPTILSLAHDEKNVALHMVSKENLFWETMEDLKEEALKRPAITAKDEISKIVNSIIKEVQ